MPKKRLSTRNVRKAVRLIGNFHIAVEDMYRMLKFESYNDFSRAYQEAVGEPPKEHRNRLLRVARLLARQEKTEGFKRKILLADDAYALIMKENYTVQNAAQNLDMSRIKLFRIFKAVTGLSPQIYCLANPDLLPSESVEELRKISVSVNLFCG